MGSPLLFRNYSTTFFRIIPCQYIVIFFHPSYLWSPHSTISSCLMYLIFSQYTDHIHSSILFLDVHRTEVRIFSIFFYFRLFSVTRFACSCNMFHTRSISVLRHQNTHQAVSVCLSVSARLLLLNFVRLRKLTRFNT
jgi:hypothetical protein